MLWLFLGAVLSVIVTLVVAAAISALLRRKEHTELARPIAPPDGGVESSTEHRATVSERTSDG